MTKKNTKLLRNKKLIPISIIILCLFFVGYVLHPINADWLLGSSAYTSVGEHPNDVYSPLKRLLLYVIILTTMLSFLILVPKHNVKLTYIGRRTMQVYLLHGLVIGVVRGYKLFPFQEPVNIYTYLYLFGLSAIIVLVLSSKPICKFVNPLIHLKKPSAFKD